MSALEASSGQTASTTSLHCRGGIGSRLPAKITKLWRGTNPVFAGNLCFCCGPISGMQVLGKHKFQLSNAFPTEIASLSFPSVVFGVANWRAASAGDGLFQHCLQFANDLRMFQIQIMSLAGIVLQIVQLAGGVRGVIGKLIVLQQLAGRVVIANGRLMSQQFPLAVSNGQKSRTFEALLQDVWTDLFAAFLLY